MRWAWLLLLAACGDNLVPPIDATGSSFDCDTQPASGAHKLFLAFDGVTLMDSGLADARYDQAAFVDNMTSTIAPWRDGVADRAARIRDVTCRIRESLHPFDVLVTRTRPTTSEDYEMIVFGGSAQDLGKPIQLDAVVDSDCSNANHRDVAWVADGQSVERTAAIAMAMFGAGNALVPSSDATNCTCLAGSGTGCNELAVCKFANTATVRTADDFCQSGETSQDQVSTLLQRYGIRIVL